MLTDGPIGGHEAIFPDLQVISVLPPKADLRADERALIFLFARFGWRLCATALQQIRVHVGYLMATAMGLPVSVDLVLRFGLEIAGVMALV